MRVLKEKKLEDGEFRGGNLSFQESFVSWNRSVCDEML